MKESKLPISEDIDFHFLLSVMPYIENDEQFSWLPELFSIVGTDKLIKLCKYAGGETIKIPTLQQLYTDIEAIQEFYEVDVRNKKGIYDVPEHLIPKLLIIRKQIAESSKSQDKEQSE